MSSNNFGWANHKERISLPTSFSRSGKEEEYPQLFTRLKESKKNTNQNNHEDLNVVAENNEVRMKRLIELRNEKVTLVVRECLMSGREISEVMTNEVMPFLYNEVRNALIDEKSGKIEQLISTKTLESTCVDIESHESRYLNESRKANKENLTIDTSAESTITKLYSPFENKSSERGRVRPQEFTLGNHESSDEKSGNLECGEEFSFNLRNGHDQVVREFCSEEKMMGDEKRVSKTYEMLKNGCFNNKMLAFSRTNVPKGKKIKDKVMGTSQTFLEK